MLGIDCSKNSFVRSYVWYSKNDKYDVDVDDGHVDVAVLLLLVVFAADDDDDDDVDDEVVAVAGSNG